MSWKVFEQSLEECFLRILCTGLLPTDHCGVYPTLTSLFFSLILTPIHPCSWTKKEGVPSTYWVPAMSQTLN